MLLLAPMKVKFKTFPVLEVFTTHKKRAREKSLAKSASRKVKPVIISLIILVSTITAFSFLHKTKAEVSIISILPPSGYVGDEVWILANVTTESDLYEVFFDQESVYNGTVVGRIVNASFLVPHAVNGAHNVTVKVGESEARTTFTVLTKYSIDIENVPKHPLQLQQNDTVIISLNVTGGEASASYTANMTVRTPANTNHTCQVSLASATEPGHHNSTIVYPDALWTAYANTNYTGTYTVSWVNGTEFRANATFFVGLTNSSQYHRGDYINIRAVNYPPDQNVTINISGVENSYSENITAPASADGTVYHDWLVPPNATIGNYTLTITPVPTSKQNANDTQTFEIPGFKIEILTVNLANHTVSNVYLRAYDNATAMNYTGVSGANGSAIMMLEKGFHVCEAFFKKEVRICEVNLTIDGEMNVTFTCQLVTANINIMDTQNVKVPFVQIDLTYNYTTTETNENRTSSDSYETNITGTVQLTALLPNVTYVINASRYGKVFNENNNTLPDLPIKMYEDITIICPAKRLQVQVIDSNSNPIQDAVVKVQELMGGLNYTNATSASGTAALECTFGKYAVKICHGEIVLNETTLELFEDQNVTIKCQLYGLKVSVKVVDFFGQPISSAKVTLQRENLAARSVLTGTDGKATFDNLIGGNMQIAVSLPGQAQTFVAQTFFVDNSTTINFRIEKYVVLAGLLVETSHFAALMIILVTVILAVLVEVYRRRRVRRVEGSKAE